MNDHNNMSNSESAKQSKYAVRFFIVVLVVLVVAKIFGSSSESGVKMYDPARTQSVNKAIESTDLAAQRANKILSEDEVKQIAEKASLEHARKNKSLPKFDN